MTKNSFFTLCFILFTGFLFSQINQVDAQKRKQGTWKKPYPNTNTIKYEGQFKDDKPYGEFTYYYESGRIEAKVVFSENGKVSRSVMYHESSGYVMAKGKYVNQLRDSLWYFFDNKGQLKSQENYKMGKLDGQKVTFYEPTNGKYIVARSEYYKNGVLHGECKEYHRNTQLKMECNYVDGNIDGTVKHYYSNGRIQKIEKYQHAVKHGIFYFYNEKGEPIGDKVYWNGKLLEGKAAEAKKAEFKAKSK